ncbi:MAG: hypothetical protein WA777_14490 [Rhodanobacter sp.]
MPTTIAELALSAAYRQAQRALAAWLERGSAEMRRGAFATRAAIAGLDDAERHRLARWLAWLCVAARSRGESIQMRIQRLDAALSMTVEDVLARLPGGMDPMPGHDYRLSMPLPTGTAPYMTSVRSSR